MIMMAIAALEQDDRAFMLNLYNDYYGLVSKNIYHITRDADNTEDLINDTFIKLIENIFSIRTMESCKLAAYVVYTSRSVAINFIKHRGVQQKHAYYGENTDLTEKMASLEDSPEDRAIHQEELKELVNTIFRLPEKQRDVLYFKYLLEMKDSEIAAMLNIAPDSVRQYLTRARRNARELMYREVNDHAQQQPEENQETAI